MSPAGSKTWIVIDHSAFPSCCQRYFCQSSYDWKMVVMSDLAFHVVDQLLNYETSSCSVIIIL